MSLTLSCARFNMGDGKFGAAYAQEDGVAFKEESTGNNERIGEQKRMGMRMGIIRIILLTISRAVQLPGRERQHHRGEVLCWCQRIQVDK